MAATDAPDQLMVLPSVWDILIKKLSYIAQSDTSISKLIPDFEGLYRKVLNKLEAKPLLLTVINYAKKRNDTIVVGKVGLQWLIRNFMTDARTYYMIPALVYTIDKGDYRVFSKQIEPFYNNFSRSLMATAVDCSVGWSEERRKIAMQETTGALFSTVNMQWISACEWLGNKVKPESRSRIFSTVPVLFISGTLDTSAPPFQAEEMRWGFPNSNHLIVENGSHESLLDKNVQSIMVDFLKGVDVQQRTAKFNLPDFLSPAELILRNSTNK
jgi:pimeloyl-ACP methyl ester carboxylesterase